MRVTGVLTLTAAVVIRKPAEVVDPAATLTADGTDATPGLLLESFIETPPEEAGAMRLAVLEAAAATPPTTVVEERFKEATPSGFMVSGAVAVAFAEVAVIVIWTLDATYPAVMVNGAEEALAGTTKVVGIMAAVPLELERVTVSPPAGASPCRFTIFPVVVAPPAITLGVKMTELTSAA